MSLIEREYMNRDRSYKSSHQAKKHHHQDRVRTYMNPAVMEVIYADEWDEHLKKLHARDHISKKVRKVSDKDVMVAGGIICALLAVVALYMQRCGCV